MEPLQTPEQATLDTAQVTPAATDTAQEQLTGQTDYQSMSPQELVDHLAVLLQQEELPDRKLVESIRVQFIRRRDRLDTSDKALIEAFEVQELRLDGLLTTFKAQDKKRQEALELIYQENKAKKEAILERFEEIFKNNEDGAEFGNLYARFSALRDEWSAITELDLKDAAQLNKRYYELRDQFYDLKAINDDLRHLDFKKNLEAKQAILAELRTLDDIKDTIQAHRRLIELTAQWHELGPVDKEHRQEINSEFKQLSTAQHKRHQEFHDRKKASEEENLQAKEQLCLRVEELLEDAALTSRNAFARGVEKIKEWQQEWRTIGRAPAKSNEEIYLRFRAGIDAFFRRRSELSKELHAHEQELLEKKRALIERAKALRESTAWEETAAAFKALQEEWKQLGNLSARYSQKVWDEFRENFDYFFDRKKKEAPRRDQAAKEARKNSAAKREILARLEAIASGEAPANLSEILKEENERWKQIGAPLHRDREELNSSYRKLLDDLHGRLRRGRSDRHLSNYSANLDKLDDKEEGLLSEHHRLRRQLTRLKHDLQQYEANLTRFNVSSKGGSSLLAEAERKREALITDIQLTEKKLALLEEKERQSEEG